ncbi:MAG TPA: pyrimidine dimer DNA glycosylase/endonuclease V [Desulfomonilia bacterium]
MRLWSMHPKYLDAAGLTALWREGLLAGKALSCGTTGYRNHPQLERFKKEPVPGKAIDAYLAEVLKEARLRGYKFNASKIREISYEGKIPVTKGQIEYEWRHLLSKLERRSPSLFKKYLMLHSPEPHPLFVIVPGGVEPWEKLRNYQT